MIHVSPQVTISQLLRLICEKRSLEVKDHRFDLPATEESLAGKTLEQLKITSIRVVMRGKESIDQSILFQSIDNYVCKNFSLKGPRYHFLFCRGS